MVKRLPNNFQIASESQIASYNWTDLASGTGYVTMNCLIGEEGDQSGGTPSASNIYILTENTQIGSGTDNYVVTSCAGASEYSKDIDVNFDTNEFQSPRTIKGIVNIGFSRVLSCTGSGSSNFGSYQYVRLYKYDGTNETLLGSAQTPNIGRGTTGDEQESIFINIDVGEVNMAIGDKLRVTLEVWTSEGTGSVANGNITIGVDPLNRDVNSGGHSSSGLTAADNPTKFLVDVPFRIIN